MLFRHCLFFIAITLLTFSVAIPIPSGVEQGNSQPTGHDSAQPSKQGKKLSKSQRRNIAAAEAARKAFENAPPDHAENCMKQTKNVPKPDDEFHMDDLKFTGVQVRKAIEKSFLPRYHGYPKHFGNYPYPDTHPDASLRGKRTIPHNPPNLRAYPLTDEKDGWRGGEPGRARVVVSKVGEEHSFHGVIVHDPSRGGGITAHYLATHVQAKKEG